MQSNEFNAFVAAIVSARGANLMTPKRAEELIESAANRAGFAMKNMPAEKAAVCDAIVASNAVVNGRKMKLDESASLSIKEFYPGQEVFVSGKVVTIETTGAPDGAKVRMEVRFGAHTCMWAPGNTEVIIPNA